MLACAGRLGLPHTLAQGLDITMTIRSIAAGLLALTLAFTHASTAAAAEEIPTTISGTGDSSEYPDPICTTCKVKTVRSSRSDATHAFIELAYLDSMSFVGDLVVTVWLEGGADEVVVIPDVALVYGDVKWLEVSADHGWRWDEVKAVELELVPLE